MYTEYNELGQVIRYGDKNNLDVLIADVREFGGCVIRKDTGEFVAGSEWVYRKMFK